MYRKEKGFVLRRGKEKKRKEKDLVEIMTIQENL